LTGVVELQTAVSFRLAGGDHPLILVPANVNDTGPYDFILDTGATISLLSSQLAVNLGIPTSDVMDARVAGGPVQVRIGKVDSLAIGTAKLENVPVAIMDLSDIGEEVGAKIDGDIGYSYLKHFQVVIDYRKRIIALIRNEQTEDNRAGAISAQVKFTLADPSKPLILVRVLVNDQGPFLFALDTGASIVAISPELASGLGIKLAVGEALTTGGGHKADILSGKVESLAIGIVELRDLPIVVGDFLDTLSHASGIKMDGIIGYNYLKEFIVTIDYTNQTLGLA
jgi:predicted aspartyl protease